MNLISLDLEMNQPSRKIIQIGACVFNSNTGEILNEFNKIIFTNEKIDPFITELTKITQEDVLKGSDLKSAYVELCKLRKKYQAHRSIVTWGDGDVKLLKEQVFETYKKDQEAFSWDLGFRFFDTKTLYQAYRIANDQSMKAGLSNAMTNMGLTFEGQEHDALCDAKNTAKIFCKLIWNLKRKTF